MQNQNLQQSFIETNTQTNSITHIHLPKNRHMINRLVYTLKSLNNTAYNNNLAINSLPDAKIVHRLNQTWIGLRKLESNILTIYNNVDSLIIKIVTLVSLTLSISEQY